MLVYVHMCTNCICQSAYICIYALFNSMSHYDIYYPIYVLMSVYMYTQVCLSLLGTWAGPSWDPKTSTLLQVFIHFILHTLNVYIVAICCWVNIAVYQHTASIYTYTSYTPLLYTTYVYILFHNAHAASIHALYPWLTYTLYYTIYTLS